MPEDLRIDALGVPITVTFGAGVDDQAAAHVREIWAAARSSSPVATRTLRASIESGSGRERAGADLVIARNLRGLESALSSRITLAAIEERKHDLLMLHGCAVADETGAVYAFVGPSGRGKSTLSRSLARIAQYVTDETVGISRDGTVLPHPKPLSIIDPGAGDGVKTQVAPANLGLREASGLDLRIERVFLLDRRPDAAGVTLEGITLADSLEHLVPQLSYLPSLPQPLHRLAELYDRVGGFAVLTYSEADDVTAAFAAGDLTALEPHEWEETFTSDRLAAAASTETGDDAEATRFERMPMIDSIVTDGRLCLLRDSTVTVLDGIGPTVWALSERPRSLDELVRSVVHVHGEPADGDAGQLVAVTVAELVDAGVLQPVEILEDAVQP
jgi:energy-coupling factor transporter ATP-binding protein EcfA2